VLDINLFNKFWFVRIEKRRLMEKLINFLKEKIKGFINKNRKNKGGISLLYS